MKIKMKVKAVQMFQSGLITVFLEHTNLPPSIHHVSRGNPVQEESFSMEGMMQQGLRMAQKVMLEQMMDEQKLSKIVLTPEEFESSPLTVNQEIMVEIQLCPH